MKVLLGWLLKAILAVLGVFAVVSVTSLGMGKASDAQRPKAQALLEYHASPVAADTALKLAQAEKLQAEAKLTSAQADNIVVLVPAVTLLYLLVAMVVLIVLVALIKIVLRFVERPTQFKSSL